MNRYFLTFYLLSSTLFSVNILWDLGVGITEFSHPQKTQDIQASTYHRLEGTKKYYESDYKGALFHFEQTESHDLSAVLYEYIDSMFELGYYTLALTIIEHYNIEDLTDNLLYLKSKIYLKLNLLSEALNCLFYIKEKFPNSDYNTILMFDIDKINLRKND